MKFMILLLAPIVLASCGDSCTKYSDFNCSEIQEADYNVYFYYPSGTEKHLGSTNGLSQCGAIAHRFADKQSFSSSDSWGYICCMIANGSSCYEKHR